MVFYNLSMIRLSALSKKFNGNLAVNKLNLTIKRGEIVGLLGPNGAGKTTTLRMIAGVLPQTSGDIFINNINLKTDEKKLKKLIGYLPENNPLYTDLTVEEYLSFFTKIKGIEDNKVGKAIEFVVKATGINSVYYQPIAQLSKGFKQRAGLSQALLTKPDILILDEPTEGLDPNQRGQIQKLILNLGKKRIVIISSHVLSEVSKICNRIVIIHKGGIVADGKPSQLKNIDGKTSIVETEIEGREVLTTLKEIDGVIKVIKVGNNYYRLEVVKGKDIRKKVFKTAILKQWTLLTLYKKEIGLEEVFSQLTKE